MKLLHLLCFISVASSRVNGKSPYSDGLFFQLNSTIYHDGDYVLIDDIGTQPDEHRVDPGSTLVCDTRNVNSMCCRGSDNYYGNGALGDWYYNLDNTKVPANKDSMNLTNLFVRVGYAHQMRLSKKGNPSALGEYRCVIPHEFTGVNISATINVVAASGPVQNLNVTSQDESTLNITWTSPSIFKGNISAFNIKITRFGSNVLIANVNVSAFTYMASDLEPGVPYSVMVAAINERGIGEVMSKLTFSKELFPNIAPTILSARRSSGTTVEINWMPLTVVEARGFIKNYTIAYTPIICSQKRQQSIAVHKIVAGDQSSTTVDGLDENAAYAVQMFATTGGGQGKIETIVGVSTFKQTTSEKISTVGSKDNMNNNMIIITSATSFIVVLIIILIGLCVATSFIKSRYSKQKSATTPTMCNHEYESVEAKRHKEFKPSHDTEDIEMRSSQTYGKINTQSNNDDIHDTTATLYERVN